MEAQILAIFVAILTLSMGNCHASEQKTERGKKMFSMFSIIRFANDACAGSGTKNGTCYSQQECESKRGVNVGSCADGFGVCCAFTIGCGDSSSENCTYFESTSAVAGACPSEICPCSNNICQLRLDFDVFVITGPSSATTLTANVLTINGLAADAGTAESMSIKSQCLTDTFHVIGRGGVSNSDVLCGTNTGEHLYVEAAGNYCSQLVFQLGSVGINNQAVINRRWSMKVSQYNCNSPNLAPAGCKQYFYGPLTGTISTFNYDNGNGHHLANQEQTVCVRREINNCRICWYATRGADFQLSGRTGAAAEGFNTGQRCCDHGSKGIDGEAGYDCIHIPGAQTNAAVANAVMVGSNFCGRSNGLVITTNGFGVGRTVGMTSNINSKTICSRRTPFQLTFFSDNWEIVGVNNDAKGQDTGARLSYFMDAANCIFS